MKESWPGATAQRIATRLAAHQLLDDPRVFDDPLALSTIGSDRALTLRTDPYRFETAVESSYLRAFVAARSRYAEDELAVGIESGVRQCVILSAGLATSAYRNPYPQGGSACLRSTTLRRRGGNDRVSRRSASHLPRVSRLSPSILRIHATNWPAP